jgi:CRISPR-associated protein Csb1
MNNEVEKLLNDSSTVALSITQPLEPMEGRETPIYPATYPAAERQGHRYDTPYTINKFNDDRLVATLDSIQSQANRMEAAFSADLEHAVPKVTVTAGDRIVCLTDLPHRLADAAIRATDLHDEIRTAFEAYDAGDPHPMAQVGPTSLVYGAWDSRDTRIKVPRLIRSEILAWDVDVFTRSAQFSGSFSREELGFTEKEWKQGAEIGFAPAPSVDDHGGVLVRGNIRQIATIHLGQCRSLDRATAGLGSYILGLALGGFWTGGRDYSLRTGCWLVPDGPPEITIISRQGERTQINLDEDSAVRYLEDVALPAARKLDIALDGKSPRNATYSQELGKKLLKKKTQD